VTVLGTPLFLNPSSVKGHEIFETPRVIDKGMLEKTEISSCEDIESRIRAETPGKNRGNQSAGIVVCAIPIVSPGDIVHGML
jgi:hypothetical protein